MEDQASYGDFSVTVQRTFDRLRADEPLTAGAIAVELQRIHPDYAEGRLGAAETDPSMGPRRAIGEWADLVRSRYEADEVRATRHGVIDTRLTLLALMHLDESLAASMSEAGAVGGLRAESDLRPRRPPGSLGETLSSVLEPPSTGAEDDHVFICYSRSDSGVVRDIVGELRAQGVPTWIDTEDIAPGANWDRSIDEALRDSPSVLVFLSPQSVVSDEVQAEWSLALDEGKAVIPVLLADCDVPRRLRARQHTDLRGRPIDIDRLNRLAASLRGTHQRGQLDEMAAGGPSAPAETVARASDMPFESPEATRSRPQARGDNADAAIFTVRFAYRDSARTWARIIARNEGPGEARNVLLEVWGVKGGARVEANRVEDGDYGTNELLQAGESAHVAVAFAMGWPLAEDLRYRLTWTDGRGEQVEERQVPLESG